MRAQIVHSKILLLMTANKSTYQESDAEKLALFMFANTL